MEIHHLRVPDGHFVYRAEELGRTAYTLKDSFSFRLFWGRQWLRRRGKLLHGWWRGTWLNWGRFAGWLLATNLRWSNNLLYSLRSCFMKLEMMAVEVFNS